jgi:hypothetical protein
VKEGVFSAWNGHNPKKLRPARRSDTLSDTISTISEAFLIAEIFSSGMYAAKKSRLHFEWIRVLSCSGGV